MPSIPTISVNNDGTGTSFTATVDVGAETDTATLYLRRSDDTAWTTGESRTGDGDIQQTGLDRGIYEMIAVAEDDTGALSLPSDPTHVRVYDPDAELSPNRGPLRAMDRLADTLSECPAWQSWTGSANELEARRHVHLFGIDPPREWAAETAFAYGRTHEANDMLFEITTPGVTGEEEPDWSVSTEDGDTVADGGAIWTAHEIEGDAENTSVNIARPMAIIIPPDSYGGQTNSGESSLSGSTIRLYFEADIDTTHTYTVEDAGVYFARKISEVHTEMMDLCGTAGHAAPNQLRIRDLKRAPEEQRNARGDYAFSIWEASY